MPDSGSLVCIGLAVAARLCIALNLDCFGSLEDELLVNLFGAVRGEVNFLFLGDVTF